MQHFCSFSPNNCSNRGKCVGHQCVCKGDWIAKDCSIHACPDSCGVGDGRGICSKEHCRCKLVSKLDTKFSIHFQKSKRKKKSKCNFLFISVQGYSGKSCSLHIDNNVENEWHYLASAYSGLTARAAHSAIYVRETDSLYVYGGHNLNDILGALQVCFNQKKKKKYEKIHLYSPEICNG